ncbi:hypothetical protein DFH07DRAFT_1062795 [Mycena maculata]|uniref:Uncharacterized protein n=1 Tax=Mycena maculata TaxID=230809 RepID=A0AAD7INH5_9AGAR|nr:hypothetical protein DFH07DRAFT_1062795 [Mycena maculata]
MARPFSAQQHHHLERSHPGLCLHWRSRQSQRDLVDVRGSLHVLRGRVGFTSNVLTVFVGMLAGAAMVL